MSIDFDPLFFLEWVRGHFKKRIQFYERRFTKLTVISKKCIKKNHIYLIWIWEGKETDSMKNGSVFVRVVCLCIFQIH